MSLLSCNRFRNLNWYPYQSSNLSDCACNAIGRLNNHCNEDTGCCRCKEGFGGDLCDKCADGKYGFPTCQGNTFISSNIDKRKTFQEKITWNLK